MIPGDPELVPFQIVLDRRVVIHGAITLTSSVHIHLALGTDGDRGNPVETSRTDVSGDPNLSSTRVVLDRGVIRVGAIGKTSSGRNRHSLPRPQRCRPRSRLHLQRYGNG